MMTKTAPRQTARGKDGKFAVPANYTGQLLVWGFDCIPDAFDVVDGKIVNQTGFSVGDWTKVG